LWTTTGFFASAIEPGYARAPIAARLRRPNQFPRSVRSCPNRTPRLTENRRTPEPARSPMFGESSQPRTRTYMNAKFVNVRQPEGCTAHEYAGSIPVKLTKEELLELSTLSQIRSCFH